MSSDLAQVTRRQVPRILARAGWERGRQSGGGHIILKRADGTGRVSIPDHPGDLRERTLRSILKQAGLTVEQFNDLRRG